jgi:ribosomal protein S18 acetylase RimI-like enzyme
MQNYIFNAMVKFRDATDADFELAFQIKENSIKPYIEKIWGWDDKVQREYHKNDFKPEHIQIILDNNNNEIGLLNTTEDNESIYIKSILIHHAAQGTGIGTKIITAIIERSRLTNKRIELQVFKINERAKGLYEKLGFVTIGQTEWHYQMKI